jgi:Leucine-rich repeat (LRR) protein
LQEAYQAWLPLSIDEAGPDLRMASGQTELALGFSALSDAQLERLQAPDLRWLQLTKTRVTDAGLQHVALHHRRLEELYLDQTRVSDAGVVPLLQANPQLESLDLAGTQITDASVLACQDLQRLEALWLTGTAVTDACVPQLLKLPKLEQLDVQGTQISPARQQELRARFK